MQFLLSISCSFLFAAGLFFVMIALYTNYDKVFRYIGIGLIILAAMSAIDIWIIPGQSTLESKLYWQKILHVIVGLAAVVVAKQVRLLTKNTSTMHEKLIIFMFMIVSLLVVSTDMLQIKNSAVVGNLLYTTVFVPYILICGWFFTYPVYRRLQLHIPSEGRVLNFQLYGMLILVFFGCLDMFQFLKPEGSIFPDYKVFGILFYGIANSMIFAEHFLHLIQERDDGKKRLESAYAEVLQSNSLKQLGESTAIINHEIKNYMFVISGNAQLLQEVEKLSGKGNELVGHIVSAVERLQNFSKDILELSRTHILQDKHPLNLSKLIRDVVEKQFRGRSENFDLKGLGLENTIQGDWDKLYQVFTNLFSNALDAKHPEESLDIRVSISSTQNVLLVTVEDNGIGCNEEQLKKMFTAFFTTKIGRSGTGLGLSISRTLVESHGGKISVYSKNLADKKQHGLKFQISFPNFSAEIPQDLDRKSPILVIKEGLPNIGELIRVFQNVYVTPYFVQNVGELLQQNFQRKAVTLLASAETIKSHFPTLKKEYSKVCLISEQQGSLFAYEFGNGKSPVHFSEEYVLQNLIPHPNSGLKVRESSPLAVSA